MHKPNPSPRIGGRFLVFILSFFVFRSLFLISGLSLPVVAERSHYLCSYFEGITYCLFCLVLMVGFVAISVVVGEKDSFFR